MNLIFLKQFQKYHINDNYILFINLIITFFFINTFEKMNFVIKVKVFIKKPDSMLSGFFEII